MRSSTSHGVYRSVGCGLAPGAGCPAHVARHTHRAIRGLLVADRSWLHGAKASHRARPVLPASGMTSSRCRSVSVRVVWAAQVSCKTTVYTWGAIIDVATRFVYSAVALTKFRAGVRYAACPRYDAAKSRIQGGEPGCMHSNVVCDVLSRRIANT